MRPLKSNRYIVIVSVPLRAAGERRKASGDACHFLVEATFTAALKAHLAKKGFDPQMGARPMARLIQDTIRTALADELLFGRLANGGKVTVDVDANDKVHLGFDEEVASVT